MLNPSKCRVPDCGEPVRCRGLCSRCYAREYARNRVAKASRPTDYASEIAALKTQVAQLLEDKATLEAQLAAKKVPPPLPATPVVPANVDEMASLIRTTAVPMAARLKVLSEQVYKAKSWVTEGHASALSELETSLAIDTSLRDGWEGVWSAVSFLHEQVIPKPPTR
jgi:hypothetical protein